MLKRYLLAFTAAGVLTALPALAQDHAHQSQAKLVKGSSIAIEGCVTAGQKADTFVLGSLKEIPGVPLETGMRRVYWLDSTKQLRGHAGHTVQIAGRIDKVETSEIEVKLGANDDGSAVVEIEGAGTQIKTSPATIGVGTAGQTKKEVDIPTTVVRLKVDKVTMKGSCGS